MEQGKDGERPLKVQSVSSPLSIDTHDTRTDELLLWCSVLRGITVWFKKRKWFLGCLWRSHFERWSTGGLRRWLHGAVYTLNSYSCQ